MSFGFVISILLMNNARFMLLDNIKSKMDDGVGLLVSAEWSLPHIPIVFHFVDNNNQVLMF